MKQATATIVQLVRAHYNRDDETFASAALALGRAASDRTPLLQQKIFEIMKGGYPPPTAPSRAAQSQPRSAPASRRQTEDPGSFQTLTLTTSKSSILEPLAPVDFVDLLLEPGLQFMLDEICQELEYRQELAKRKLRARTRLLFYGPPGNGKTSAATALGKAIGVPAYAVRLPSLLSSYIAGTTENLGELFNSLQPNTLVVMDEIDAIGARRSDGQSGGSKVLNNTVNALLTLMDRSDHGIIVGTTNRLDILDEALLRRFDEHIKFPAPSLAQKEALMARLCEGWNVPVQPVDDCENFDAVGKRAHSEARRHVMRELIGEPDDDEGDDDSEDGAPAGPLQ